MKYIFFDVEKLIEDEEFIQWIKYPNPERNFFWESFLSEFPEKRATVMEARAILESFLEDDVMLPKEDVGSIRNTLISKLKETQANVPQVKVKEWNTLAYLKVAATLLLIVAAGCLFYFFQANHQEQEIAFIEKVSTNGQRSSLILPDGSKVWLNGGSKIKYRDGLENQQTREVFLEGEAFFEVVKSENKPFVVNTNGIKIRVLGTKFNVKSYNTESTIETTLIEGSVSINKNKDDVILKPNEKAIISKTEGNIELLTVDPRKDYAWKEGFLIVENESFAGTIEKLERWYGVNIELTGGEHCKLNFKLSGETLQEVLKNLKEALKISYKKVNNGYLIEAINCH